MAQLFQKRPPLPPQNDHQSDSMQKQADRPSGFQTVRPKKSGDPATRPLKVLAIISAALLIPGIVSLGFGSSSAVYEYPGPSYWGDELSYEQYDPQIYEDQLIVSYRIRKDDPETAVSFTLDVNASADEADSTDGFPYQEYDWIGSSMMGFECDEVFVSSVMPFNNHPVQDLSDLDIETRLDSIYVQQPDDFDYLTEDGTKDFTEAYRKANPEKFAELRLDSDGVASQNGIVTFTVSLPENLDPGYTPYLSGSVNIIYKKDGQPVFGGIYSYVSSTPARSRSFAYTPDGKVPEYDEVQLVDMHD